MKKAAFPLAVSAGLFVALLWLFTRSNDFPVTYHPDEGGKVEQVVRVSRNYRHPQLMLEASTLYSRLLGHGQTIKKTKEVPDDLAQVIVRDGRTVSAMFAAAAVVVLALTAYQAAGAWPMVLAGAAVGLCGPLLVNAHYMKEDTSLVFGMALTVWAGFNVWQRRTGDDQARARSAMWLGAACAVAVSGKYVGIAFVIPALLLLLTKPVRPADRAVRNRLLRAAAIGFFVALAVINWRIFNNPVAFAKALSNQTVEGIADHKGLTTHKPSGFFTVAVWQETVAPVRLVAILGSVAFLAMAWKLRRPWLAIVPILPAYYLLLMSFGSMANHRYVLPVTVLLYFIVALVMSLLIVRLRARPAMVHLVGLLAMLFILSAEWPMAMAMDREFKNDSRKRVSEWLVENLPPGSVVFLDAGLKLDPPFIRPDPKAQTAFATRNLVVDFDSGIDPISAADLGPNRYAVVCDLAYSRYFNGTLQPLPEFVEEFAHRREGYTRIFDQGHLVWEGGPGTLTWSSNNPLIRVYELKALNPPGK